MPDPVALLAAEEERLRKEIARLNADSQSGDEEKALLANKRLQTLTDDYRTVLLALNTAQSSAATDPNDAAYKQAQTGYLTAQTDKLRNPDNPANSASVLAANISASVQAANLQWDKEKAAIEQAFNERKLTFEQAQAQATEAYNRIRLDLDAKQNDVQQRGQDMTFADQMANTAANYATATMPYYVPKGTAEDLAAIRGGYQSGQVVNTPARTMDAPYPSDYPTQIVAMALRGISPYAAALAGGDTSGGLQLPPRVNSTPNLAPPVFGGA